MRWRPRGFASDPAGRDYSAPLASNWTKGRGSGEDNGGKGNEKDGDGREKKWK